VPRSGGLVERPLHLLRAVELTDHLQSRIAARRLAEQESALERCVGWKLDRRLPGSAGVESASVDTVEFTTFSDRRRCPVVAVAAQEPVAIAGVGHGILGV
jgi:hypothetical protein